MKNLTTLLFLIPFVVLSQYKFDVSVELPKANKSVVDELQTHVNITDKNIDGNVISFLTHVNHSEQEIDSLFVLIGADPFMVIKNKITTSQYYEKAGGNNCESAELLCSGSSVAGSSAGPGTQELNNTNQGCLSGENQSSWYYVNIQTGGTFTFLINPNNNSNDYDFAVWGPFTPLTANANCPPISNPIRCSWASTTGNTGLQTGIAQTSEGVFGDGFVGFMNVTPGQIYIVMIDNWSASNQGYGLSFGGSSTLGCLPVVLPIELYSFVGDNMGEKSNNLYWSTSSEYNNDHFTLERSEDGINWSTINVQASGGNSTENQDYSFIDWDYKNDIINYYRLSQIDNDGYLRVYDVISIDNRKPVDGKIVKTVNSIGQEVDPDKPAGGVVFDIYDNGVIRRRMLKSE